MSKTVVQVWSQKARNMSAESTWGIGDQLRGLVNLKEIAWRRGWDMRVDIRNHPIERFLHPDASVVESEHMQEGVDFVVFDSFWGIDRFLSRSLRDHASVWLSTNGGGRWPGKVSEEAKLFAKTLLHPCDEILQKVAAYGGTEYSIIHFRLGDQEMTGGRTGAFEYELSLLKKYAKPSDILLTDSYVFKMLAKKEFGINVTSTVPVHVGVADATDGYLDTLFEFFLVAGARSIVTYSVYPWTSGFVLAASKIYDVPLVRISGRNGLSYYRRARNTLGAFRDDFVLNVLRLIHWFGPNVSR